MYIRVYTYTRIHVCTCICVFVQTLIHFVATCYVSPDRDRSLPPRLLNVIYNVMFLQYAHIVQLWVYLYFVCVCVCVCAK